MFSSWVAREQIHVRVDHDANQVVEAHFWFPTEKQFLLLALLNGGNCARNFAADESFAAPRAFMIKHDAVAGAETVALAIIHGCPIRKNLGHTIGAARPERRLLILGHLLGFTE